VVGPAPPNTIYRKIILTASGLFGIMETWTMVFSYDIHGMPCLRFAFARRLRSLWFCSLWQGWNMVGDPFVSSVPIASVTFGRRLVYLQ
jgi:hypothetical protein